jgi:hypothetical protein
MQQEIKITLKSQVNELGSFEIKITRNMQPGR